MTPKDKCDRIIEEHYYEILNRCRFLLRDDLQSADDCAHDVFVLLLLKKDELDLDKNIRGWLYACADRICKDYRKKRQRQAQTQTDLEEAERIKVTEPLISEDTFTSGVFKTLSEDDVELLKDYFSAEHGGRKDVAKKHKMTMNGLYKRISAIRAKLKNSIK